MSGRKAIAASLLVHTNPPCTFQIMSQQLFFSTLVGTDSQLATLFSTPELVTNFYSVFISRLAAVDFE